MDVQPPNRRAMWLRLYLNSVINAALGIACILLAFRSSSPYLIPIGAGLILWGGFSFFWTRRRHRQSRRGGDLSSGNGPAGPH